MSFHTNQIKLPMENRSVEYRKQQWLSTCAKYHKPGEFDYSLVAYIDNNTKVEIVCKKGHHFMQTPHAHRVRGCPICKAENSKHLIFGIGVNDGQNESYGEIYIMWHSMLRRCYSAVFQKRLHAYENCQVAEEWKIFSNFKRWALDPRNGYQKGYQLDKDILVKGNKIYGPETSCFVPKQLNLLFTKRWTCRGSLPIGVSKYRNRYVSSFHYKGRQCHLGYFDSPTEAFVAYKAAKESYIKECANVFYARNEITERVYNALMNYQVEITD